MTRRRKICYITTISSTIKAFFIPQLLELSKTYDVTVVCAPDPTLQQQLGNCIKYHPIDIPRGVSFGKMLSAVKKLDSIFKKEQFDLIQYSTPNAALCASIASKIAGCKVRNYHLMGYRYMGEHGVFRFVLKLLERVSCRASTQIECVSRSSLEMGIREKLFPKAKATVVWNGSSGGIDLQRFDISKRTAYRSEIRKQYGIKEDAFLFGYVGRITKDKGVNEILAAFFSIPDALLLMVGSPDGIDTLDPELYNKAQMDPRIVFTGPEEDIERYYAAVDVLLLPSYREGFGNVVIEAAAMGTPAIVSNIPGPIDATIENVTALWIQPHSVEALYSAMKCIMNTSIVEMSQKARQYVCDRFDQTVLNEHVLRRKEELLGASEV